MCSIPLVESSPARDGIAFDCLLGQPRIVLGDCATSELLRLTMRFKGLPERRRDGGIEHGAPALERRRRWWSRNIVAIRHSQHHILSDISLF